MKDLFALLWSTQPINDEPQHRQLCFQTFIWHGDGVMPLFCIATNWDVRQKFKHCVKLTGHTVWILIKRITMQLLPGWSWCYPPTLYHELLWRCSSLSICQLLFLPLPGCLFSFRQYLTTLALIPGHQKVVKFILITCEAWLNWHHTEIHGGTACSNSMSANQFFSQQHSSLAWKLWHAPC